MKKNSKAAEALADLQRTGRGPMDREALAKINRALAGPASLLVAAACDIAAENDLREFVPEMISAFGRFAVDGEKVDKGCAAKTAVIKALTRFEYLGGEIFQAGAYCIQFEPAFGPPEDTAVELRSLCALSLARINHIDANYVLTDLLMDEAAGVRIAAAKALTYLGTVEGELLLRLKALAGDTGDVRGECFLGLMTMAPHRSLEFVARFLDDGDPVTLEGAAIAIGSSHLPEALATLLRTWERSVSTARRTLLLPIALVRSDEAFEFLLEALRAEDRRTALEALAALRLYPADPYVTRVREAVKARKDPQIEAKFREEFGEE